MAARGEPLRWLREQAGRSTDECIIWPFNPQGLVLYEGRLRRAYHVALLLAGRSVPVAPLECRHLCNTWLCVNERHLASGTHEENIADRLGHSVAVTADDVRAIRASSDPIKVLAARYGVSQTTIRNIRHRRRWANIT